MRFRLPYKRDELPVDENNQRPADNEGFVEKGTESQGAEVGIKEQKQDDIVNPDFQHGVQAAQAMTQVWSFSHIVAAYILIWVIHFIMAFASGMIGNLTPFVTSSFAEHSLTATTSIISSLASGLIKLPYAKLMDIWGRPQGFALMVGSMTIGLIMMAGCKNVETYCAAQVFYQVGYTGLDFTMTIFVADTSKLKNRAFWIAFVASPYIATVWAYGPAAQSALGTVGFRWGFGVWAIVIPVVSAPLFFLFYYNQRKAEKMGLLPKIESNRTTLQSIVHYVREFDLIGISIFALGMALFLLAFNLYTKQADEWRSPLIICFLIFGGLLIVGFILYERYFAPVTFIPWELLKNRTVIFTYTMAASLYIAWYIWDNYFYSMLLVVYNQDVTKASYISNIYTVGSSFWAIVMGVVIRYNGRLKWQALYFGVPVTILGVALMIHFRHAGVNIGYIVMCHIFIAFGGGTLVICEQMTVMAVSRQQDIPAILAAESMFIYIGSAVGSSIAAAMWTGIFPAKLKENLPADALPNLATIYGDITAQYGYAVGSPERDAINLSYSQTQRLMLITATCLYSVTLVSVLLWKDVNVKNIHQVKGRVF
ncbi:major facilitator superfamily domain-containing protein [Aspergillus foveolatus]|uniref:major facilitator superfamily domain-containing protein n=1 Tax=Aspergillus foveolatus TaxID=210207 RepID=UPI003CCE2336